MNISWRIRLDDPKGLDAPKVSDEFFLSSLDNADYPGNALVVLLIARVMAMRIGSLFRRDFDDIVWKRTAHALSRYEIFAFGSLNETVASSPNVDATPWIAARRPPGMRTPACHDAIAR